MYYIIIEITTTLVIILILKLLHARKVLRSPCLLITVAAFPTNQRGRTVEVRNGFADIHYVFLVNIIPTVSLS